MVEITSDLAVIILIITSASRNLDFLNVSVFSNIGGPLHKHSRETDAGDNTLEQLQFGYTPRVLVSTHTHNGILVIMKLLQ